MPCNSPRNISTAKVPAAGTLNDYDRETLKEFADVKSQVEQLLDVFKFRDAQKEAMNLARIGTNIWQTPNRGNLPNRHVERVGTILNIALQLVANLAIAFEPFLPFSSEKLRNMLNMENLTGTNWGTLACCRQDTVGHARTAVREDSRRRCHPVFA